MKKILSISLLLMMTLAINAQKEVTKFLGIPVDGTKAAMIEKLKAKGFTTYPYEKGFLTGEFNGYNVILSVVTNKDKVWRITLMDSRLRDETNIKDRFNELCHQFERNPKYIAFTNESQSLSENEDISYQMMLKNKCYEAYYYQRMDSATIANEVQKYGLTKYTEEQLTNPTEEIMKDLLEFAMDLTMNKSVWFMIAREDNGYRLVMYYQNEYNRAKGEDL